MGLFHSLSSIDLDHSGCKPHSHELAVPRISDVIGEKLCVQLNFLEHFLGLNIDHSKHVVVCVGDYVLLCGVDAEVHDLLVFLFYTSKLHV